MLVSRRVEDEVRPVMPNHPIHPAGIAHGADEYFQIQLREVAPKLLLDVIGIVLVNVENNQHFRLGSRNLTAQLAADASAAAGDQYGFSVDIAENFLQIHLDGISAQ